MPTVQRKKRRRSPGFVGPPLKKKRRRTPVVGVTKSPVSCQVKGWFNLCQLAYILWKRHGGKSFTVYEVSGAIRALKLKHLTKPTKAMVNGVVIYRQQTMIDPTQLRGIETYLREKGRI